ncbi:Queuosine biosynthesis protein QueC [Roseovarius pacificus]|uniref:Queuosine biosynthesis protein QueC n=1 Tax=Roseovarius pacificus TaxID=337701 RepID=A0A1M7IPU8_9RHOB|nr:7-cyano-7-deazaguanine synthase [Roseovarius pacificus]GGO61458.1 hypothetical protein GCM10011315_38200 [Roseovarius pacificus]SHM42842.1 Queuosine biosynthesis protein QueC [Roseovarius pacificus]
MIIDAPNPAISRKLSVEVVESDAKRASADHTLVLGRDIRFSTRDLESYANANWEPVVFDAMVVAAAVEYCDRSLRRSVREWARDFRLRLPVHEPDRWSTPEVLDALHDALGFLTGDRWHFTFVKRVHAEPSPRQQSLDLPPDAKATLAFSDGMDSRAVAGLVGADARQALVRVRLGTKRCDRPRRGQPFTGIPYKLGKSAPNPEPSARNRGFRFALVSGLASYICRAEQIIIPESGQGALGPVLVPVAHAYPDYRNHPAFLRRMERFLGALFGHSVEYTFPRIWHTKGQTLAAYLGLGIDHGEWKRTRSCWKGPQWSSVDGQYRQCGACAACMLRRLSVHAAGQTEAADTYIAADLSAPELEASVPATFRKANRSFREYAIAGVLHLDHLADLTREDGRPVLRRQALVLAEALGMSAVQTEQNLKAMIAEHAGEWRAFVASLGDGSFLHNWVRGSR